MHHSTVLHDPRAVSTPSQLAEQLAHRQRQRRIAIAAQRGQLSEPPAKSGAELIEEWRERQRAIPIPVNVEEAPQVSVAVVDAIPTFATIAQVQRAVAKFYDIGLNELFSIRRTAQVVRRRQIAMYLCRVVTQRSMPEIARRFGGMDHTTILHAVNKISGLVATDAALASEIGSIKAVLLGDTACSEASE